MRRVVFALLVPLLAAGCTGARPDRTIAGPTGTGFSPPPTVSCPAPVIPPGTYAAMILHGDVSKSYEQLAATFAAGHWTWTVGGVPNYHCFFSTYLSHIENGQVTDIEVPFYTVAGPHRIVIHWCCSIPDGTYEVSLPENGVRLDTIHDDEHEFAAILSTEVWTKAPGVAP
jgi:hypothetical protein